MTIDKEQLIAAIYNAFNARDIDSVLNHLVPEVDWPNGMTGGREHGRAAVRTYWEKQWREIDKLNARLQALEQAAAVAGVHLRPVARFERLAGRLGSTIDVGRIALGHVGDLLFGGRVECCECLSAFRVAPFAVDQQLSLADFGRRTGTG